MWIIAKRITLFATVNILVLLTVSITACLAMTFVGVSPATQLELLTLYSMIGMGGAFVSLALSRITAKLMLGVRVIENETHDPVERQLVDIVYELARNAGLRKMPEVGIYESPEVNAFATGPTKSRALVAVSTGLLQQMNHAQVEGVLGHELSHVASGDMVTMTLVQGVINTLVLILARLIAIAISNNFEERTRGGIQLLTFYMMQVVLSIFGSVLVNYFSRLREFRADSGGAKLAGREKMIGALRALSGVYGVVDDEHQALATLKISGHSRKMVSLMFSTHPPLDERIRRLEKGA